MDLKDAILDKKPWEDVISLLAPFEGKFAILLDKHVKLVRGKQARMSKQKHKDWLEIQEEDCLDITNQVKGFLGLGGYVLTRSLRKAKRIIVRQLTNKVKNSRRPRKRNMEQI